MELNRETKKDQVMDQLRDLAKEGAALNRQMRSADLRERLDLVIKRKEIEGKLCQLRDQLCQRASLMQKTVRTNYTTR